MKKEFQEKLDYLTKLMSDALKNSKHSFRIFSFGTSHNSRPNVRTVVLRDFNFKNQTFDCHSDIRSPKIKELSDNNLIEAMFYCPDNKVQARISGKAKVLHENQETMSRWNTLSESSKRCYMGPYSPSEKLESYHPNIPEDFQFKNPTKKESEIGFKNFVVIRINFDKIDYLELKYSGHKRIQFNFANKEVSANWIAP